MDQPAFVEEREIAVTGKGLLLTVSLTQEFIDRICRHLGLAAGVSPTDDQVRDYVREQVQKYLDKLEGTTWAAPTVT